MKKPVKIALVVAVIIALWLAVFAVDAYRSANLMKPAFAFAGTTADDGGSGTYYGAGYTVEIKMTLDPDFGPTVISAEMRLFGKFFVAASIT